MINYSKMMLSSIKANMDEAAIEEENKRKKQKAIKENNSSFVDTQE